MVTRRDGGVLASAQGGIRDLRSVVPDFDDGSASATACGSGRLTHGCVSRSMWVGMRLPRVSGRWVNLQANPVPIPSYGASTRRRAV